MAKDETINFQEIHVVRMGKKKIGEIRAEFDEKKAVKGYRYFPNGQKEGGNLYYSLLSCKQSLTEG